MPGTISFIFRNMRTVGKTVVATALLHLSFSVAYAQDELPPSRVASLNYLDGTVSFSPAGTDDWSVATVNRPLTIGDRVWTDKGARSELHVGSTAMRLGASSSLEFLDLNDTDAQLKVAQGSFALSIRDLPQDDNLEVDTPNLAFVVHEPGEYRFDVDPAHDTTIVTVRRGSGQAYGSGTDSRPVTMSANHQLTFSGTDLFYSHAGDAPSRDPLDRWAADRDAREDNSRSTRYVSRDMTGYEELDDDGDWRDVADYGPVWVPRVTVRDWAPYHYGHWAWIAPWGWTWVDDERWGFAPFHYGRWAHINNYWAWVPGPVTRRPVYAPALVGFVGGGNGASWGVSLSVGTPGVAWFALAPGEHYRPAYTSNPTYITRINSTVVVKRTVVNNNIYINQRVPHAIAAMPASEFVRGTSAHDHRRDIRDDKMREFSKMPSASSLPVAPVRQSISGGRPASPAAPPAPVRDHAVVERRQSPEPAVYHDNLAHKFATRQGTVPGAGPAFTPTARPVHANPPPSEPRQGNGERARPEPQEERSGRPATGPDALHGTTPAGAPRPVTPTIAAPRPPANEAPAPTRQVARPPEQPNVAPGAQPNVRPTEQRPAHENQADVPRPPPEQRRDTMRNEPASNEHGQQGASEKRAGPSVSPGEVVRPPTPEARPAVVERPRDDNRMRADRPQNEHPVEQAPRPTTQERPPTRPPEVQQEHRQERPAPVEHRNDVREARPQAEERHAEPPRPPQQAQPQQAPQHEEHKQKPDGDHHDKGKRDDHKP